MNIRTKDILIMLECAPIAFWESLLLTQKNIIKVLTLEVKILNAS